MTRRETISRVTGDLTGDGLSETVTLSGVRFEDSNAYREMRITVQDGALCTETVLALNDEAGYDPRVTLVRLTETGGADILFSAATGGSGGIGLYRAYAYLDGEYRVIFDSEAYNAENAYTVTYLDDYVVRVDSQSAGLRYLIDISQKDADILRMSYSDTGALLRPQTGGVNPLSLLAPVYRQNGVYGLLAFQRITGLFGADGLGDVLNLLAWTGERFEIAYQTVGVIGTDIG